MGGIENKAAYRDQKTDFIEMMVKKPWVGKQKCVELFLLVLLTFYPAFFCSLRFQEAKKTRFKRNGSNYFLITHSAPRNFMLEYGESKIPLISRNICEKWSANNVEIMARCVKVL